jgi:hypothetical protein
MQEVIACPASASDVLWVAALCGIYYFNVICVKIVYVSKRNWRDVTSTNEYINIEYCSPYPLVQCFWTFCDPGTIEVFKSSSTFGTITVLILQITID